MKVQMNYGKEGLELELPKEWNAKVIHKPEMPILNNECEGVHHALNQAVVCAPLAQLAKGKSSACIAICDITRPVPNGILLPPLLETLEAAGIPRQNICILIATGLHRPNLGEELITVLGSAEIAANYQVENHYATRSEEHTFFAATSQGTPVGIDTRFVEAELKIVVGLVEPHFMAGFSGGRKVVAPGIAHESTIRTFHNAHFMGHAQARNLNLEGNPLHKEQLAILEQLGPVYALNVVLDEARHLSAVNFGEVVESHLQLVQSSQDFFRVPVPKRYQTVITSGAGYPLDLTFYQVVKGMVGAKAALAQGGLLVIVARCAEGLGSKEFHNCQQRLIELGVEEFLKEIGKRELSEIDEWETQKLTEMLLQGRILLYSPEWSDASRKLCAVESCNDVIATVNDWLAQNKDPEILIIPEGPYVIPVAE